MNSQYDDLSNLTVQDMLGQVTFNVQFRDYNNKNSTDYKAINLNRFGSQSITDIESTFNSDSLFVLDFHKKLVKNLKQLKFIESDLNQ